MKKIAILICLILTTYSGFAWETKICTEHLSNSVMFYDYKNYLLITNHITDRQYIYWKKQGKLQTVEIDTTMIRKVYVDYLHNPAAYTEYMQKASKSASFKPKISSTCAYDDSTVLGCLMTVRRDTSISGKDTVVDFIQMPSIVEISANKSCRVSFVSDHLPIPFHSFNKSVYSNKKTVYLTLCPEIDNPDIDYNALHYLAKLKKKQSVYGVDQVMSATVNDYLVTNKVFTNYNHVYFDNGYSLMSLSNYLINLETEQKIFLPIADSIFRNIRIDPNTHMIRYYLWDFKYNKEEQRFYIRYELDDDQYTASFKANATSLENNVLMFSYGSEFGKTIKAVCLSWDGKQIVYSRKGEDCFYYATPEELKATATNYKKSN